MTRVCRLGLGTVQFGQNYGVSNRRGQVPAEEVDAILRRAAAAGMSTIDTAAGYGDAEQVLGSRHELTRQFRIVTKSASVKAGVTAVIARARNSVETLRRKPVDLLLVHAAGDLHGIEGDELWNGLLALRDEGLFAGIGISAYVDDDPVALARRFRPAAMQIPLSLLDQRLVRSGALTTLKELGVAIHARSVFLQGLLFLEEDALPVKLKHAAPHLAQIRRQFKSAGTSPLAAALAFVLDQPEVDAAIVGVTSVGELEQILTASQEPSPHLDWAKLALDDPMVLTPSSW